MLGLALVALVGVLALYLISQRCVRKRREGEPPLITGWIPFLGKALEFAKDAHRFLADHKEKYGDIFTVQIAGKYMTFIMNPLLYRYVIKQGRQLDFHEFSDQAAPVAFGYPPVFSGRFPGLHEQIQRSFRLLQGDSLTALTQTMTANLLLVLKQDHLGAGRGGGGGPEERRGGGEGLGERGGGGEGPEERRGGDEGPQERWGGGEGPQERRGGGEGPQERRGGGEGPQERRGGCEGPQERRGGGEGPQERRGGGEGPQERRGGGEGPQERWGGGEGPQERKGGGEGPGEGRGRGRGGGEGPPEDGAEATADGGWRTENMYEFCNAVMFEATFLTMYGGPAQAARHGGMDVLREDFVKFDTMFPLLIAQIPIWLLGGTKTIREKLISYFLPHRMSQWANTSPFIRNRAELFNQYNSLSDIDKAAHHFAILWASVGNTVPATFWAMYHLVTHREALEAVRREVQDVLSGAGEVQGGDVALNKEQLDSLLYLNSSIHESLRLSSASMNIRVAQEDFCLRLEGARSAAVRRGDVIALYPQSMHMDADVYQDPEEYKYDRYMENGKEKTDFYKGKQRLSPYLMPFGSGSSMCPGRSFAVNEIKQFLSLLLLHFDIEVPAGQRRVTLDTSRAGLGILLPANSVYFRYRPRRA